MSTLDVHCRIQHRSNRRRNQRGGALDRKGRGYYTLVVAGKTMVQELTHTRTGTTLRSAQSGLPSGLYRILIPAGTHLWFSLCRLVGLAEQGNN